MKNYYLDKMYHYDEVFYFDANMLLSWKVITVIKLIPVQKIHHFYEDSCIDVDLILWLMDIIKAEAEIRAELGNTPFAWVNQAPDKLLVIT